MLADSGEDAIAFSTISDYAANLEMAEAVAPAAPRAAPAEELNKVVTPYQRTCEMVAELLKIPLHRTVKSVAVMGEQGFVLALVRGDHSVPRSRSASWRLARFRMATEAEILEHMGTSRFSGRSARSGRSRSCADVRSPR